MIVRGESTIIDYNAPFDQGLIENNEVIALEIQRDFMTECFRLNSCVDYHMTGLWTFVLK